MATQTVRIGDLGVVLEAEIVNSAGSSIDVSAATTKELRLRKPDKTEATVTAVFTTDGTDGKVRYVSLAATFDVLGEWAYQARVVMPSQTLTTRRGTFVVEDLIGD